jgi:hypothetical protein
MRAEDDKAAHVDRKDIAGGNTVTLLMYVNPKTAGPIICELWEWPDEGLSL